MKRRGPARCLFGPVDHTTLNKDLKEKLKAATTEASKRWNFDFENDVPLSGGKYEWCSMDDENSENMPNFYGKSYSDQEVEKKRRKQKRGVSKTETKLCGTSSNTSPKAEEQEPCLSCATIHHRGLRNCVSESSLSGNSPVSSHRQGQTFERLNIMDSKQCMSVDCSKRRLEFSLHKKSQEERMDTEMITTTPKNRIGTGDTVKTLLRSLSPIENMVQYRTPVKRCKTV